MLSTAMHHFLNSLRINHRQLKFASRHVSTTVIAKWIPGEFSQGAGVNGKSLRLLPEGWLMMFG